MRTASFHRSFKRGTYLLDSQRLVLGGNRLEIGFPVVKLAYQGRTVVRGISANHEVIVVELLVLILSS